jgi:anti-sigma regulatory factor (Ser/Thr protein kinase)
MTVPVGRHAHGRFDHAALIIDSDTTIEQRLLPVLRHHITTGEPAMLVVSKHTERVVRTRLGAAADTLEWGQPDAFYQRLGFAFNSFRRYLRRQHASGRSVHVIAEPNIVTDLTAPVDRVAAYLSYEAVCNDAFVDFGCPVTCIWDGRRHPTLVIEGVRSIHDHELTERGRQQNSAFVPTSDYLTARADVAMPAPPADVDVDHTLTDLTQLAEGRAVVTGWAAARGFSTNATEQVVTAANEVVTNALQHGTPPVRLRAWYHRAVLVVHVDDRGGRPIPPYSGYRPPAPPHVAMGLWVARQFADVVLTRTTRDLTEVRMYFPHALTHRGQEDDS